MLIAWNGRVFVLDRGFRVQGGGCQVLPVVVNVELCIVRLVSVGVVMF